MMWVLEACGKVFVISILMGGTMTVTFLLLIKFTAMFAKLIGLAP